MGNCKQANAKMATETIEEVLCPVEELQINELSIENFHNITNRS